MGQVVSKVALTVDDSKTMREMVSFTLKGAGFEVLEAEDGNHALSVLGGRNIDVVITDLNMPNMNGLDLIRSLRSNPQYQGVPILMLTTESDGTKKEEGKSAGATGWIVKPFQPEKLVAIISKVCP